MKDSMLKSVRMDAGLGNPPSEYTNNDPEAANFMIKHGLHFDSKKPHEFIQEIKNIIETQQRNEDRAVFGKGPFQIREGFKHLVVDDITWAQLTHVQRMRKLSTFLKAEIDDRKDPIQDPTETAPIDTPPSLTIDAKSSGITTIPAAILEAMFQKATNLRATPGKIIPKPGATDESFIVAGVCNKIHVVTPGKGGSLVCDRACVNHSTKMCEHTLAVAQVTDKLQGFIDWYRRSRRGPKMIDMAVSGGPKCAGKKPSKRKRTNAKSQPVHETADLLEDPSSHSPKHAKEDCHALHDQRPSMAFANQIPAVHVSHQSSGLATLNQGHSPPGFDSSCVQSSAPHNQIGLNNILHSAVGLSNGGFLASHGQYHSSFINQNIALPSHLGGQSPSVIYASQQHQSYAGQVVGMPGANNSSFQLKWVAGTKVTRCYGCGGDIQNPPLGAPEDIVIVYRDIRRYRDRYTGQLHCTDTPQNVHFHLRIACVRARYPHFTGSCLSVPMEFAVRFGVEHVGRLMSEFGWTP